MFHKLCGELPPGVEKFVMDVQEFSYEVVYRPGKMCIADYMSRHHAKCEGSSPVTKIEAAVHSAVSNRNASCHALHEHRPVSLADIRKEG